MDEMIYKTQVWLNETYGGKTGYNSLNLDNEKIARLVLNEVYWQIKLQEILIEAHKNLLYTIQVKYAENEKVL